MKFIELFAGIGGFRLGLEPLGWKCVWANEIDPYACNVYRKNFGDRELFEGDIKNVNPNDIPEFDMLTAGFPCQDISNAGKREGIKEGNRSGLWFEIVRIIRSRSPHWVFLENVAALTIRGLDIVLRDLSESGYDAQWDCVPASAVGAPHRRDRIWIVAYPRCISGGDNKQESIKRNREEKLEKRERNPKTTKASGSSPQRDIEPRHLDRNSKSDDSETLGKIQEGQDTKPRGISGEISNTECRGLAWTAEQEMEKSIFFAKSRERWSEWEIEPDVGRVAHGIPSRVDRLKCLGNAVVPQVVTHVGRCIDNYIKNNS